MTLTMRPYAGDDDYWRIRRFLRQVFLLNGRREHSWPAYRFDYWRWHGVANLDQGPPQAGVFLWETPGGELAAVLNREEPGHTYLQVHPAHRSAALEDEMIAAAEARFGVTARDGRRRVLVWVQEDDAFRQEAVQRRGFVEYPERFSRQFQRWQRLDDPANPPLVAPLPEGYAVRALRGRAELPARSWLSWRAFHPDEPDEAYEGWDWYLNIQRAPLYRRQLDLVAVAPDGELASFCTVWFDDVTRTGAFEPVGTSPDHQRRGLGKAVMAEGLRRLRQVGATLAFVGSNREPAHRLYASAGFVDYVVSQAWVKVLD